MIVCSLNYLECTLCSRYPTNKWVKLGTFHARDERNVQSFPLDEQMYAKYMKVILCITMGSFTFGMDKVFMCVRCGETVHAILPVQEEKKNQANWAHMYPCTADVYALGLCAGGYCCQTVPRTPISICTELFWNNIQVKATFLC